MYSASILTDEHKRLFNLKNSANYIPKPAKQINDVYVLDYIGETYAGTWHGEGCVVYSDGSTYEGQFMLGMRHGNGRLTSQGHVYSGMWKHDLQHGAGCTMSPDGTIFNGYYLRGLRSGLGKLTSIALQYTYEGEFSDSFHGYGELLHENGDLYKGMFSQGKQEGEGMFVSATGEVHEVVFREGRPYNTSDGSGSDIPVFMGTDDEVSATSVSRRKTQACHFIDTLNDATESAIENNAARDNNDDEGPLQQCHSPLENLTNSCNNDNNNNIIDKNEKETVQGTLIGEKYQENMHNISPACSRSWEPEGKDPII